MVARRGGRVDQGLENVAAYHMLSSEVGKVASKAGARALLLNHFVPVAFDPDALVAEVTAHFAGPVVIGEDLLSIDVPNRTVGFERLRVALGSA
jgi:ribonuclease Z